MSNSPIDDQNYTSDDQTHNSSEQHDHKDQSHDQTTDDHTMDQGVDRSSAPPDSPEALGVSWLEGRYSGKKLRPWLYQACVTTVWFLALGIWWMVRGGMGNYVLFCWILVLLPPVYTWCHYAFAYFYRTWTIKYRLTAHRLYNEKGLFKKTIDTLEIIDIEDMKLEQTFFDRFVCGGIGTIIIVSHDKTNPELKLEAIENPLQAFESIDELRRRRRSAGARIIRSVTS